MNIRHQILSDRLFSLTVCVLLLLSFDCDAQIELEPNVVVSKDILPDGLADIEAGDINNDGNIDLVTSDLNDERIYWHDNITGEGRFISTKLVCGYCIRTTDIHLDDVDEDGDLDIITLSNDRDTVAWLENIDGTGDFQNRHIINDSNEDPSSLNVEDYDNDGRTDLAFTDDDGNIYIYRKNGTSTIYDEPIIISNSFFDGAILSSSDINGDGNMDLILADERGDKIYYLLNSGTGISFGPQTLIDDDSNTPIIIEATDLDNDGDQDLITFEKNDFALMWYENMDGLGNYGQPVVIDDLLINAHSIKTSDINQDGQLEIITSSTGSDKLNIYTRTDSNQDFAEVIISEELRFARGLTIADINQDARQDIVVTSSEDAMVYWFDNLGVDWEFDQKPVASKELEVPRIPQLYDVDGDGDLDIVTSSQKQTQINSQVIWYENIDGNGSFLTEKDLFFIDDVRISQVIPADLNGDNNTDYIITRNSNLSWYKINEVSGIYEQSIIDEEFSSLSAVILDYDLDGDMDIVSTLTEGSNVNLTLRLFTNLDGMGTFDQGIELGLSGEFFSYLEMNILDYDFDSYPDIIVGTTGGNFIIYRNNQGVNFIENQLTDPFNIMSDYSPGDVDHDGDLDFVSIYDFSNELRLTRTNSDSQTHEIIVIDDDFEDGTSVELSDIDGDGDLDIFATNISGRKLFWYENSNFDGVFLPAQTLGTVQSQTRIAGVVDIDKNGKFDPFVYSPFFGEMKWFRNGGRSSSSVVGFVKLDAKDNGCTEGALPLEGIQVTTEGNNEVYSFLTLQNGFYRALTTEGEYSTSVAQTGIDYFSPITSEFTSTFIDSITLDTVDFCLVKDGDVYDLQLSIIPINQTRPGFTSEYEVIVKNVGTTPIGGSVCISFDSLQIKLLSSLDSLQFVKADSLVYKVDSIGVYERSHNFINYQVSLPQLINLEEPVCILGLVKSDSLDSNLENNDFKLNDLLVNSYDPNDITVLEGDKILEEQKSDFLHYVIRFQNTGTADAINVRLENDLDEKLDHTTLQLISSSHDVKTSIINGEIAQFAFDGIYLPDSNANEALSHGYVSYRIKPYPELALGDIITNNAGIFFDFNDPVLTNTVSTEVVDVVSTSSLSNINVELFPNPATSSITISSETDIISIQIYNRFGKLMMLSKINTVAIQDLSKGLYYCQVKLKNGSEKTIPFLKM